MCCPKLPRHREIAISSDTASRPPSIRRAMRMVLSRTMLVAVASVSALAPTDLSGVRANAGAATSTRRTVLASLRVLIHFANHSCCLQTYELQQMFYIFIYNASSNFSRMVSSFCGKILSSMTRRLRSIKMSLGYVAVGANCGRRSSYEARTGADEMW